MSDAIAYDVTISLELYEDEAQDRAREIAEACRAFSASVRCDLIEVVKRDEKVAA